jgi:antitoxin component of MazEF toxin-antitoxin module
MTVPVKNQAPVIVPPAVLRRAGFTRGQQLEVKASRGVITILPKLPSADGEYTPEQRRVVDARLAEGLADVRAGRTYGPFGTASEMIAHMKSPLTTKATAKKTKRPR